MPSLSSYLFNPPMRGALGFSLAVGASFWFLAPVTRAAQGQPGAAPRRGNPTPKNHPHCRTASEKRGWGTDFSGHAPYVLEIRFRTRIDCALL